MPLTVHPSTLVFVLVQIIQDIAASGHHVHPWGQVVGLLKCRVWEIVESYEREREGLDATALYTSSLAADTESSEGLGPTPPPSLVPTSTCRKRNRTEGGVSRSGSMCKTTSSNWSAPSGPASGALHPPVQRAVRESKSPACEKLSLILKGGHNHQEPVLSSFFLQRGPCTHSHE